MPRYASPAEPLPPTVTKAMMIFGANPIRGAIIHLLSSHPEGMTSGAIRTELSATYQTVFRHLQELETAGVVTTDAGEKRQGHRVLYKTDSAAVRIALAGYESYLLGE